MGKHNERRPTELKGLRHMSELMECCTLLCNARG